MGNVVKNKMPFKLKLLGTFVGDYFQLKMNPHSVLSECVWQRDVVSGTDSK